MIREESIKNVNDVFASMTHLQNQQFDMPAYLALSRLLYLFERIGDSCTNIAEDTVYLINGVNMKHQNK